MKKILFSSLLLVGFFTSIQAQKMSEKKWVRKQFAALNLNEKIGQFMVIRTHSNWSQKSIDSISNLIQQYNVGGLCFFQGGPVRQAMQTPCDGRSPPRDTRPVRSFALPQPCPQAFPSR